MKIELRGGQFDGRQLYVPDNFKIGSEIRIPIPPPIGVLMDVNYAHSRLQIANFRLTENFHNGKQVAELLTN